MQAEVKVREPNLFIESKTKMSRWELILWLYAIRSVKIEAETQDLNELKKEEKPFSVYAIINLEKLAEYVATIKEEEEKKPLRPKDILDYSKYFRQLLKNLMKESVFEIEYEKYKESLEGLGYSYWLKFLPPNIDKSSPIATAVIKGIYKLENGKLRIDFVDLIAPFIAEYKKWYSTYKLKELLKLSNKHSLILYRIFRKNLGLKRYFFRIDIEDLKELLNLNLKNFQINSMILKPAIGEINEKTDLKVSYKPIRKGRGGKLVAFEFEIKEKKGNLSVEDILKNPKLLESWLVETLRELAEDLNMSEEMLKEKITGINRIRTSAIIWYLLNFPKEIREFGLRQLEVLNDDENVKYPEGILKKSLSGNSDLEFLFDDRVNALIEKILGIEKEQGLSYKRYYTYD